MTTSDQYNVPPEIVDAFLADLGALTLRHGIAIGGCGCCGSPYLYHVPQPQGAHGYIRPVVYEGSARLSCERIQWRHEGAEYLTDRPDPHDPSEKLVPPGQGEPR